MNEKAQIRSGVCTINIQRDEMHIQEQLKIDVNMKQGRDKLMKGWIEEVHDETLTTSLIFVSSTWPCMKGSQGHKPGYSDCCKLLCGPWNQLMEIVMYHGVNGWHTWQRWCIEYEGCWSKSESSIAKIIKSWQYPPPSFGVQWCYLVVHACDHC